MKGESVDLSEIEVLAGEEEEGRIGRTMGSEGGCPLPPPGPHPPTRPHLRHYSAPISTTTAAATTHYLPQPEPGPSSGGSRQKAACFNLEPEYIPASRGAFSPEMEEEELRIEDLTESQMRELKEQSQKRVKRIVAAVGITLTIISVVLVALSLSLGPKIDDLVSQSTRGTQYEGVGPEDYLGPLIKTTEPPTLSPTTT